MLKSFSLSKLGLTTKSIALTVGVVVVLACTLAYVSISTVQRAIERQAIERQNTSLRIAAMEMSELYPAP